MIMILEWMSPIAIFFLVLIINASHIIILLYLLFFVSYIGNQISV